MKFIGWFCGGVVWLMIMIYGYESSSPKRAE